MKMKELVPLKKLFKLLAFGLIAPLTSFSLVMFWYDKKEILNLTELWTIPAIFISMASALKVIYEKRKLNIPWWVLAFLSRFSMGAFIHSKWIEYSWSNDCG
jgi:hypothetical protein